MGHSKGGIDSAAALAMHASLRPLVAGIVFVQTPYGGSPVATDLMEGDGIEFELLRAFVLDFLASILRTKADAGVDLTYSERRAFLERFPLDPQDPSYLRRPTAAETSSSSSPSSSSSSSSQPPLSFPMLSFHSTIGESNFLSPFALTAAYMRRRYDVASDGMVAAVDAEVPGSAVVR